MFRVLLSAKSIIRRATETSANERTIQRNDITRSDANNWIKKVTNSSHWLYSDQFTNFISFYRHFIAKKAKLNKIDEDQVMAEVVDDQS